MAAGPEAFRSTSPDLYVLDLQKINNHGSRGILSREDRKPGDLAVHKCGP